MTNLWRSVLVAVLSGVTVPVTAAPAATTGSGPCVATAAQARADGGHRYGFEEYQRILRSGRTTCAEARLVVDTATRGGSVSPSRIRKTVRLPHSTWKCETRCYRRTFGVVESTHRTRCSLSGHGRRAGTAAVTFHRIS